MDAFLLTVFGPSVTGLAVAAAAAAGRRPRAPFVWMPVVGMVVVGLIGVIIGHLTGRYAYGHGGGCFAPGIHMAIGLWAGTGLGPWLGTACAWRATLPSSPRHRITVQKRH